MAQNCTPNTCDRGHAIMYIQCISRAMIIANLSEAQILRWGILVARGIQLSRYQ